MATFKFGRAIDLHWQGYEIVGPAETEFSIPDQLYEEFNDDIAPVEPTLVWIDTNEFLTLTNAVSVTTLTGTSPIVVTATSSGKNISLSANYQTAGTYVNAVIGTSPASVFTASGTSTVSIVAGSINSTHLSATSVGSSQLIALAVTTAKIGSGAAAATTVLTADGAGNASFQATSGGVGLDSVFLLMGA